MSLQCGEVSKTLRFLDANHRGQFLTPATPFLGVQPKDPTGYDCNCYRCYCPGPSHCCKGILSNA